MKKKHTEQQEIVSFKCSQSTIERLNQFCSITGMTKKAVYELAINQYLDQYQKQLDKVLLERSLN